MKQVSLALRVAGVAAMAMFFRYVSCHPAGEHPANAPCRRGLFSPLSARKATPAAEKKRPGFYSPLLQGVTHYTLQARRVCQTFPLDSLSAGLAPCSPPPAAAGKGGAGVSAMRSGRASHNHRHHCHHRHRPKNTRRKKKGVERLCLTQSCVSRNARQAPWLPVNATMNGRKRRTRAILILIWNAPSTTIILCRRHATPIKKRSTAWCRRQAARCGKTA